MGKHFLTFVILDIEAGKEEEALAGLVKNLEPEVGGKFGPAAIWEIRHGSDYAVELRLEDAGNVEDLDTLLVDKIRSVPGIVETSVRPIYNFQFIDRDGSRKAYEAAREDSADMLGVVLCDVTCGKDRAVHEALMALKPAGGVTPLDVEMGFHSVDFDLAVLLIGASETDFTKYIRDHVRSIDGVHDTFCEEWQIARVFGEPEAFVKGWTEMAGE